MSSASADWSPFMIFGGNPSERLLACCDLRLDFDVRLRCLGAPPINNSPSMNPFCPVLRITVSERL